MTEKQAIEMHLQIIKQAVDNLLKVLPKEQQYLGSECQGIDSAANVLYHKYVKPAKDNRGRDDDDQPGRAEGIDDE